MPLTETTLELADLSNEISVPADQCADYQRDGHTIVRGLVTREELAPYRKAIVDSADAEAVRYRPLAERDTYGKAFLQIMNLRSKNEVVGKFVLARRFAKVAADLMDVDGVRIYHDQALFKEPGGGPTPWHQDQHYWPLDTDKTITMWMPLVNIPVEVGSMSFGSGSHTLGYLGDLPISDKSQTELDNFIAERHITVQSYGSMSAGDATFHSGWTLHCAPGNPTSLMREVMTIIYYADGARVATPENKAQESDLKNWLSGTKPGDLAESPHNPLVYSRQ